MGAHLPELIKCSPSLTFPPTTNVLGLWYGVPPGDACCYGAKQEQQGMSHLLGS